jgi:hypothetical protein
MSTNFPSTAIDAYTRPQTTDQTSSPSHAGQHDNAYDAIEALEAKVGIDSSAVTTSHDYKLARILTTAQAVSSTKRVTTITSHATPTINTDNCDCVTITAQAEAITSMTTNLSGTPTNFQTLIFRIKDDGTARAITWGASFVAKGVALPTTTVISKLLTVGFIYDTVLSTWGCVAALSEA